MIGARGVNTPTDLYGDIMDVGTVRLALVYVCRNNLVDPDGDVDWPCVINFPVCYLAADGETGDGMFDHGQANR